ncbi:MAG: tripartite tricarboxylate transporter substrate binding protein [Betaproteobacteria bacterium]
MRFKHITHAAATLALALGFGVAQAQDYPNRPIRVIAPFPAGSGPDVNAREMAAKLTPLLGQTVIVENRPGAAGAIGTDAAAKAAPDGYTLYIGTTSTLSIVPYIYSKLTFNAERDFTPISLMGVLNTGLIAHPSVPVQSVAELIDYAKSRPGQVAYASQGNGSSGHLAMELLCSMAGISMIHIPYRGSAPALTDLIGGRVQFMFDNTTSSLPQVARGALKAIAVAERERLKAAPNIPTVQESGLRDFEATPWFGVVTRAGTPRESIERLSAAITQAVNRPEVQARFAPLGVELRGTTPAAFAAHIASELVKWERIVKLSGAKLD